VPVLIAGQLELCFGLIAASLPALNFWLSKFVPKILHRIRIVSKTKYGDGTTEQTKVATNQVSYTDGDYTRPEISQIKHPNEPSPKPLFKYSYPDHSHSSSFSAAETEASLELIIQPPPPATVKSDA
jgi:hypothetical protein